MHKLVLKIKNPALAFFDPGFHTTHTHTTLITLISTDASDYGLGAVVSQVGPDGTEKKQLLLHPGPSPLLSANMLLRRRKLSPVSGPWSGGERRVTLRTDHQALTTLLTTKGVGRVGLHVARWSAHLVSYNYDIVYHPGKENAPADYMSRLPLPSVSPVDNPPSSTTADNDKEYVALLSFLQLIWTLPSASYSELTKLRFITSKGPQP